MPELLLSSAPVKKSSLNPLLNSIDRPDETSKTTTTNGLDGPVTRVNKDSGFNNILSSVVKNSNIGQTELSTETELAQLSQVVENLVNELAKLDPDSSALADIQNFLSGQDISTLSLENTNDGTSLPEFMATFELLISSMLASVEDTSGLPLSTSLDDESAVELQQLFTQFNIVVSELTNKTEASVNDSPGSLLGFSFNLGKDKERGQWQQYNPQQLSQNGQTQAVPAEQSATGISVNGRASGLSVEQLMPETDKNFQVQMEKLISETVKDAPDVADGFSEVLVDSKEKPAFKFSDLQLRTPNEGFKQYSTTLSTPVNSQQWNEELSQKIVWFSGRNIQAAEMHLNPAELGPIDVKIHVQNDVTSVTFNVNNASVRDLLESNVVRLREMMEANGVNVGEVNIDSDSRDQSQQSSSDSGKNNFGNSAHDDADDAELVTSEQEVKIKQVNLVDYFV